VSGGAANANYPSRNAAAVYRAATSIPERSTAVPANPQAHAPLRPEMQKALQRLREMPLFAGEREIETGRYRQFSSEEKQILRNGTLLSPATIHNLQDSFPQKVSEVARTNSGKVGRK
jgi:hypothetical protein